ncbi:hypothetical protein [Streptomyces sp. NPDC060194]|uniref:hypothetical protein n=1 Tax=Streptomyces sp. NPDC060194 TaxID=3347069 RepID=UPI003663237A
MSTAVDFFTAPDDPSAAAVIAAGPGRVFATLSVGNFDAEEAVVVWECVLAGGSYDELLDAGEPRVVADDGVCVVFALSPRLSAALAAAEPQALRAAALDWSRRTAHDGRPVDADTASAVLSALTRDGGGRLYCRVA